MSDEPTPTLGVYYEHPDWFLPLFRELDRRQIPYRKLRAGREIFEPGSGPESFDLLFNRMSPSAFLRGEPRRIFFALQYLDHLEARGTPVINGAEAFRVEISKARQLDLLHRLGLPHPRTRVVHEPHRAPEAAEGLRLPVVVKPNVGGSGAGIARFETVSELRDAVGEGRVDGGVDGTLLVQEYIPPARGRITRVEVLGGRLLYAIRVYPEGDDFNLCPADVCRTPEDEKAPEGGSCPAEASGRGIRVEGCEPPPEIVEAVTRITAASGIEIGGVEYVEDARDGTIHFYDVNALSNFVSDPERVVGFDPWTRLGDWLEARLREGADAGIEGRAHGAGVPGGSSERTGSARRPASVSA